MCKKKNVFLQKKSKCLHIKPDIRIYQTLLNRYHLKADECLFIDDSLANLEGAKQAGLSVWHIPTSVA